MKKRNRRFKLILNKETLRVLSPEENREAAGGGTTTLVGSACEGGTCGTNCGTNCACGTGTCSGRQVC